VPLANADIMIADINAYFITLPTLAIAEAMIFFG
jgi:hypothetical protein